MGRLSYDTLIADQEARVAIIKQIDSDSGEAAESEECSDCKGLGGYDATTDCEVYDDWQDCTTCGGTGKVPLGGYGDAIDYKRDAFQPGD